MDEEPQAHPAEDAEPAPLGADVPDIPCETPTPAAPRPPRQLTPIHGLLGCAAMGVITLIGVIIASVVVAVRVGAANPGTVMDMAMAWAIVIQTVAQPLAIALVCLAVGVRLRAGFASEPARLGDYLLVIVGTLGAGLVGDFLVSQMTALAPGSDESLRLTQQAAEGLVRRHGLAVAMVALAMVGAVEELTFRGFLHNCFISRCQPWLVVAFTSVTFAAMHLSAAQVVGVLPIAVFFGMARLWTGSVWPGFVAHALNNALATLVMVASGDALAQTLAAQDNSGAAVVGAGLTVVATAWLWRRRR